MPLRSFRSVGFFNLFHGKSQPFDGGKTWSAVPTVKIRTQAGDVVKRAVPSAYTAVRWVGAKALAPNAADAFAYEVTVKLPAAR